MTAEPRKYLSIGDAARLLGVSPNTLRNWEREGRIRSYRTPGGRKRYRREHVEGLITE